MVASHGKCNLAPKVAYLRREKYKTLRALLYDKKLRIAFHKAAFPFRVVHTQHFFWKNTSEVF